MKILYKLGIGISGFIVFSMLGSFELVQWVEADVGLFGDYSDSEGDC